jgi:uncharacterized protein YegP (UPF0339 family)
MTLGRKPARYPTGNGDTVEVYPDGGGLWRWRRRDRDGQITASGPQGHDRRDAALRAARRNNPPRQAPR